MYNLRLTSIKPLHEGRLYDHVDILTDISQGFFIIETPFQPNRPSHQ